MVSYWELHVALIEKLRLLGLYYQHKDRLELAWLKHQLKKIPGENLTSEIDTLITLRTLGQEPAHKDGRYL
jgi:hypothetical protein